MAGSDRTSEIEVEDLVIRYGAVAAVGPVNFSVTQGEQLTLLGPSGCGKTTTLRAIAGLERPTAGAIRIRGDTVVYLRHQAHGRSADRRARGGRRAVPRPLLH